MKNELSKELHLAAGRMNFSRLIVALLKVDNQAPSAAVSLIHDAAHIFSDFIKAHSGLSDDDVRTATSMFTLAMINAKSDCSAEPLYRQSNE